ncbi:MAG: DUF2608 domain-containing protein [Rickettsiaceae bacterium]|nr:DUF2608 domain-containing protein [Rickettsiaceae bacterium]
MKLLFNLLGVLFILSTLQLAEAQALFPVIKNSNEILRYLERIPQNSIIFVDIDDTIITPESKTFRRAPYNKLIDGIKKHKSKYKNYEEIVSNWRLQRKPMLIDPNWPDTLLALKKKYRLYGLTKMDTGKFGNINSMEEWRYKELQSLGITFSNDNTVPQVSINNASFYRGLFITGANSKSQTILYYLKYLEAKTFVMIDDREEHLKDIKQFCDNNSIKFIGILFNGLVKFKDAPKPEVTLFQKNYLIEHAQWLEDEQVEKIIETLKNGIENGN